MPTVSSTHPTTVAVHYEQTVAQPPGYVAVTAPAGVAASYASDEGTNTDRIRVMEADPAFIRQGSIEDPRLQVRIFSKDTPIKGLRNADGGTITLGLTGSESTTADTNQVTETALMRLLEHCLGGLTRGYSTTVGATVVNGASYDVVAATGMDEGLLIAIADAGDAARLFPQRILTLSSETLTLDRLAPFTPATGDAIHAVATCYIDQDALSNPADANASTVTVLIEKGANIWAAVGGHFELNSMSFTRNEVPKMSFSLMAAAGYAPGDLAPSVPAWTGTVTGAAGLAVGADTKLFLEDKGTTTATCLDVVSVTVTPGVPIVPIDTVTECDEGMQGRAGYTTKPADTIIEVQCFLDTGHQDDWDVTTAKRLTYAQIGPAGSCWAIVAPECYLMEPPEFSSANESNMHTLRFICHEDDSLDATASDTNSSRSKLQIGLY